MKLKREEKAVLEALSEGGGEPGEVAEAAGVDRDGVMRHLLALQEGGLAEVVEDSTEVYLLTDEGMDAVEEGLPEKRLLGDVPEDGEAMSEVARRPSSDVAIGWLRRKGWADIEDGKLVPTHAGIEALDEESLEGRVIEALPGDGGGVEDMVSSTGASRNEVGYALDTLRERGLVRTRERVTRTASITDEGKEALSDAEVVEEVNRLTQEMLVEGSWRDVEFRKYDVSAEAEERFPGKLHPYRRLLEEMRRIFVSMGFEEIKSPTVESGFWNFDALFQPQDHPARDMQDTFYISRPDSLELPPRDPVDAVRAVHEDGGDTGSTGWGGTWSEGRAERALLRTHTTAATIRHLFEDPEPPAKVFCIDRAYRRETIDATHLPQFYQLEGIVMDEGVSFRNLLGCLETFYSEMGFTDVRFRPAYFPYTEPSVEPEVYVDGLDEWVELGGAGVFREEVTSPASVEQPVLAWGLGAGRLAMLRLGLTDLRDLYLSDMDWLRGEPICR